MVNIYNLCCLNLLPLVIRLALEQLCLTVAARGVTVALRLNRAWKRTHSCRLCDGSPTAETRPLGGALIAALSREALGVLRKLVRNAIVAVLALAPAVRLGGHEDTVLVVPLLFLELRQLDIGSGQRRTLMSAAGSIRGTHRGECPPEYRRERQ